MLFKEVRVMIIYPPEVWPSIPRNSFIGPGRTSPYLRTSAKMKPIEESVEDDVFEASSADKLELQRLP
ncbi:hypothetical protein Q9966_007519 [Columba livia]|nr:hypothetical protein Q9966_007519 [Columba livia]